MAETILITGATGLLGRALMRAFSSSSERTVVGTGLNRASSTVRRLDLLDSNAVCDLVTTVRPRVIIHAAAERHPDVGEKNPDAMRSLNVDATGTLAECAKAVGAWFQYISTDYVFDGTAAPYRPEDAPNPLNLYGQSKLDGEIVTRSLLPDAAIVRVPILYGPAETLDESPVTLIAGDLRSGRRGRIDNWAVRYPTHVDDVAQVCRGLVDFWRKGQSVGRTFHWSGDEAMTKYEMALVIASTIGIDPQGITPDDQPSLGAPRPRDSHLDCSAIEALGIGRRTPFRQGIRAALAPFMPLKE